MNEQRIIDLIDGLFVTVEESVKVLEQKEELFIHMKDRVEEYMARGESFDGAFARAKQDLGDLNELIAGFKQKATISLNEDDDSYFVRFDKGDDGGLRFGIRKVLGRLVSLSPFIYIILGITMGWWAWGWLIIPISGILFSSGSLPGKIIGLSPFIYLILGATMGGNWWAWGWLIIPISGILFGGMSSRRRGKAKRKPRVDMRLEIGEKEIFSMKSGEIEEDEDERRN